MDSYDLDDTYFPQKITKLKMVDAELYTNARVTPISLTYYGFCLANGSYTINLHFAEIMFTDDQTYGSLGRRVFDIYLQEKQVQKDFNIAQEAGVSKKIIKQFNDVAVTSNTIEIRLYWTGKGTQSLPLVSQNLSSHISQNISRKISKWLKIAQELVRQAIS